MDEKVLKPMDSCIFAAVYSSRENMDIAADPYQYSISYVFAYFAEMITRRTRRHEGSRGFK